MKLYEYARKAKKQYNEQKIEALGRYLSPVRRIEKVAPIAGDRVVAMTFDDGPMNMPPNPVNVEFKSQDSLTKLLVEIMDFYGAKGTFNVIGTTADNYPDKLGKLNSPTWGGIKSDHYPKFNEDALGGVRNQPELVKLLIEHGHELSNHGYNHILFGSNKLVYGRRNHLSSLFETAKELNELHNLIKNDFDIKMKFGRPAHYIDKIPDGFSAYDAYTLLEYNYLAASFDGGGWMPTVGDYNLDIDKMVKPFERALHENANGLNGQIIFQKDGYNMSMQTPVAHGLKKHLELLTTEGYRVITTSELIEISPFEDVPTDSDYIEKIRALEKKGQVIGFRNNTFKPEKKLTLGEMITMTLTKHDYSEFLRKEVLAGKYVKEYRKHPYFVGYKKYDMIDKINKSNVDATPLDIEKFFYEKLGREVNLGDGHDKRTITRREFIELL